MGGTVSAFPKRESDIPLALGLQNAPEPLSPNPPKDGLGGQPLKKLEGAPLNLG